MSPSEIAGIETLPFSILRRRRNDAAKLTCLVEELAGRETEGGSDRTTGFSKTGGDPGVASVEGGISAASPIPTAAQTNLPSRFVECIGLLDVLTESGEAGGGKIDFNHGEVRLTKFLPQGVESIGEKDGSSRTGQRFERDAGSQRPSVSIVVAPTHFEIFAPGVIPIRRPTAPGDIRSSDRESGMKLAVVDDINGSGRLAQPRRVEGFVRPGTACGQEDHEKDETESLDRAGQVPESAGAIFHPDNSSRTECFQRGGTVIAPLATAR